MFLALVVIACATPDPSPPAGPRMHLVVAWGRDAVAIKNVDPGKKSYRNVVLKLNLTRSGGNDGEATIGELQTDNTVTVSFFNFVDSERRRFNISTTALESVFVKGEVELGVKSAAMFICSGQICERAPDK